MLGGHTGSRTGAELAHIISLDQSYQVAGRHFVQRHQESELSLYIRVLFHRDIASRKVGRCHIVEESTAGELKTPPRVDDYFAAGLLTRDFLDRFDGRVHGEERPDFSFADVQRHSSLFLSSDSATLFPQVR